MSAKIYIASKPIANKEHAYLVYDGDGDPSTTGDQKVIRGGPEGPIGPMGRVEVEVDVDMAASKDNYEGGEDHVDRNFTELDLGAANAATVWAAMKQAAMNMETVPVDGGAANTNLPYAMLGPNSNSVIATILYHMGVEFVDVIPREGGSGDQIPASEFTGANGYIGTDGNDTWDVKLNHPKVIVDQGGDDTYTIDVNDIQKGPLVILEKREEGSNNTIVIENASVENVAVARTPRGDLAVIVDGKVVALVPQQFSGDHPLLSGVWIVPPVGSPVLIPVDDPDEVPPLSQVLPPQVDDALVPWGQAPITASPIVLDIDGDGIELTTFNASTTDTFFDVDGDGFSEQTAWVGTDDGLLARDLDESGTIDSVAELFGSPNVDGFALLAELDSNGDHVINQYDSAWSDLVVWKDADGDALTDTGELYTLSSLNIVSFDLAGVTSSSSSISGNPISHTSTYTLSGGTTRTVADAWFVHDNVNTSYEGDYELDPRTLFLPELRGFGEIANLRIVMSQDDDLFELVQQFSLDWDTSRFEDGVALDSDIAEILWTWAGVEDVASYSRGGAIDARRLEFLEQFFGNDFLQNGISPNPYVNAAALLNEAWERVFYQMKAQLLVQVGAEALFDGTISYNVFSGELEGDMDLSQDAVDALEAVAPASGAPLRHYWEQIGQFLAFTKGLGELETAENTIMDDAISATDSSLSWNEIIETSVPAWHGYALTGTPDDDTLTGTSGDDTLNGGTGNDTISGQGGNDILNGGNDADLIHGGADDDVIHGNDGNDVLYADTGSDELYGDDGADELYGSTSANILNGGAGDDTVAGDQGDDIYQYTSGNDVYQDYLGADKIVMPLGVDSGDLTFYRTQEGTGDGALFITVDGLGTIESRQFFTAYGNGHSWRIETIEFSDTSTVNFNGLTAMTTYGGEGADYIYGVQFSSHLNDTIYGFAGNDQLYGQSGNDTLDGGNGNDLLSGAGGNDTYVMSAGFDRIDWDSSGTDILWVPDGYDAGDLTIIKSGTYDVIVSIVGLGQIKIEGQLYVGYSIETISFNGGSSIDLTTTQIEQVGTSSGDSLSGITSGASIDDIMDGREGNDTLSGYYGDDTYFFSVGDDTINESGGSDIIRIREAWTPSTVSVYRTGTALIIEDQHGNTITAGQHFTIEGGGGSNAAYEIEQIIFSDSTTWTLSSIEVETRGTSSGDYISGTTDGDASTDDVMKGLGGADTLNGGAGNDDLDGGAGNDYLDGGTGNDTYRFGAGGNLDTVSEYFTGGADTLFITGGLTINDVTVSDYSSYHSKVVIDSGVDEIVLNYLRDGNSLLHVESIRFEDGFITSLPDYASWLNGTSGNDTVAGNSSDNTLVGFAGNDTMTGGSGNDDMHGGAGNDTLDGDDGTDLLYGGDGDDILYGEGGLDTLHGGDGADTFTFFTASAFSNVDVIRDFSVADDDVLDLTDILDTVYDPLTDDIADFISFSESSGSTFVSVDRDGTGGTYSMAQIVKLENVTGLGTPGLLETNGNLIAA